MCNFSVNDAFQDFDNGTGKTDRVHGVVGKSVPAALLEHWCYIHSFPVTWQGILTCL